MRFNMRFNKILFLAVFLAMPSLSGADAKDIPPSANWYFYVDLGQMRSGGPGAAVYDWLRDEVLEEVREDAGLNVEKELDTITAYSSTEDRAVLIAEGNFSQETKDIVMAFIASGGDISPLKSSGKTYFHFAGDEDIDDDVSYDAGNIEFQIDSLGDRSYISMDVKNKLIVTATEAHMQDLLKSNGKVSGRRSVEGQLLVLSAEQALVQGGMKAGVIGDEDWDSNILRNAEQVGFLVAAASDKLAIEARLVTTDAEVAESLASVARGIISLVSFDSEMDAETAAMLKNTKVENKGNNVSLSLALDPDLVVSTLRD